MLKHRLSNFHVKLINSNVRRECRRHCAYCCCYGSACWTRTRSTSPRSGALPPQLRADRHVEPSSSSPVHRMTWSDLVCSRDDFKISEICRKKRRKSEILICNVYLLLICYLQTCEQRGKRKMQLFHTSGNDSANHKSFERGKTPCTREDNMRVAPPSRVTFSC